MVYWKQLDLWSDFDRAGIATVVVIPGGPLPPARVARFFYAQNLLRYFIMTSDEIRRRFLRFFEERGHTIIPSAPLVPQNDPSVLFNTAGMQPLVPYLLGEKHPLGTRLVDVQKCVRTVDIEDIGDNTHATFFEMLGNWSLGDYFKSDAIKWSYELLMDKEKGFGLDPKRLYITVFAGDENAPRDDESAKIWQEQGVPVNRIYLLGADTNWWQAGDNGPCGPDSEMYYDVTKEGLGDLTTEQFLEADKKRQVVEIWNDVFMEYLKKDGQVVGKLPKKNVDTGAGLERLAAVLQGKDNIFDTDLFAPIMDKIDGLTPNPLPEGKGEMRNPPPRGGRGGALKAKRILADHVRTAVFMIADGVTPSNTDRGYVLRRLLRRAVRYADKLGMKAGSLTGIAEAVIGKYGGVYAEVKSQSAKVKSEIEKEENKFRETLERGLKEFNKGTEPFVLFTTYGFPIELIKELAIEKGQTIDEQQFVAEMKKHQELSRVGSEQKFKGGLADTSEVTTRLHTAHHLLLKALQMVLGPSVKQRGSNITQERLRLDFSWGEKMTDEQKKKVEEMVNEKIKEGLPVLRSELPKEEAEQLGAEHEFGAKYPDRVSVYSIGPAGATLENPQFSQAFSIEFCGGPHVSNTADLSGPDHNLTFKILKEEAVAAGIRRIKAVLTKKLL